MRHDFLRFALIGLATTSLLSACADDDTAPTPTVEVTDDGAEIVRGAPLTPASADRPDVIAMRYIEARAGVPQSQLQSLGATSAQGITHVRFEQVVAGMRVYGAYVKAAVNPNGELLQVIAKLAPNVAATRATVSVTDALSSALAMHGYPTAVPATAGARGMTTLFAKGSVFHREPSVERVLFADGRAVHEGFLVETWSQSNNQLDHTLVDGAGRVVSTERRTNNESYRVFVEDPGKGGQVLVTGGQTAESPAGWLNAALAQRSIAITGNNTRTYLDAQSDNAPDAGGTTITDGNFTAVADLAQSPSTTTNRDVAVQNLFYLNNTIHDTLYRHGFDEAAGNFQTNNFGLGGAGNDPVNAEAQDGGGLDNANMATPSDGSSPRMQMYLWSGTTPAGVVTVGASTYGYYPSSFGPALTATGTSGALAVANDGTGVGSDACEALGAGTLTGKIAIVDRGTCNFTVKVANAQAAGAVAVVIANNADGTAFGPGGTDRKVRIPSGMVSLADGNALKASASAAATVKTNPQPALRLDGDLDSDIVFHEYGHGLTWRMIGGMSGPLAGAIGEGASDTVAFLINGDDRIGEYSYGDPLGIRRQGYASYVGGYSTVTGGEVHNDGEVYAAAMYQVLENYLAAGLSATDVLDDFVDGMNYTPATPAFEDMRDGMLQSITNRGLGARSCLIWRAFAQYEIGVGADGRTAKGGRSVVVTPSTALPPGC